MPDALTLAPTPAAADAATAINEIKAALAEVPIVTADLQKLLADAKDAGLASLPTLVRDAKAFVKDFEDCLGKATQAVADLRVLLGA
jgi:hypothetical protein